MLLDMNLGEGYAYDKDGLHCLQVIKEYRPEIAVVIMSGKSGPAVFGECMYAGASAVSSHATPRFPHSVRF